MRMSSRYTPMGVEPVASPSTARSPPASFSRISVAMRLATSRAMSSWSSTTIVRMRSPPALPAGTREGPRFVKTSRASAAAPASGWPPATVFDISGRSGRERTTAAAAAGGVRDLEREAGPLHRRDVVDRHAAQVLGRERFNEDVEAVVRQHEIVLGRLVLDQLAVLEAAAPAGLDRDAQPALGGRDALGIHEGLDLDGRDGRHGQRHVRSEEHTSELQSPCNLVCRLLLEKQQ